MPEPIPPFMARDLKGFRKYFNTYTPAGKSNLIVLMIGLTAAGGYGYYKHMNQKKHHITMKDSIKDVKESMIEAKDAAKEKIKDTVNKKL